MVDPREPTPNYLEAVGQILFESQEVMTDADHFEVVQRGINPELDTANRALVYNYARTYIADPELQTRALLLIAISGTKGITGDRGWDPFPNDLKAENRARFTEAGGVLRGIVSSNLLYSQEVVLDSFNLILGLETRMREFRGVDGSIYRTAIFESGDYGPGGVEHETRHELVAMATSCLDVVRTRFPEATGELGHPLHKLYMGQLQHVSQSEVGDRIIETVLELIDGSTDDAVSDSLKLVSRAKEDGTKRAALDKAIAITVVSDRDRPVKVRREERKRKFSRKPEVIEIPEEQPSVFDRRLTLLAGEVHRDSQLKGMLELYPDYVRQIVQLHSPEAQEELWQRYAEQVAGLAFTNGSYKISEISQIMGTVQRFGEIAPAGIVAGAKDRVQQELAQSSPTTKAY